MSTMLFKVMEMHVLLAITKCVIMAIVTFNLYMSKTKFDTFAFVINFMDDDLTML
jgi:hypothetical protein